MASWEQLPSPLKESNREQADDICKKLRSIGCTVTAANRHRIHEFSAEEIELLAEMEHERWMIDRGAKGWKWGPHRDPVQRASPDLVGWHELPENRKELDRQAVRSIPPLLATIGLGIARIDDAGSSGAHGSRGPAKRE